MPYVRISDPNLLQQLANDLSRETALVVTQIDSHRLLVQILGSYSVDGMRLATFLRLRAWEAAQRTQGNKVLVEIVD
jgi:hypothetical protein